MTTMLPSARTRGSLGSPDSSGADTMPPKPRYRGRIHQGAFVASIPAAAVLISAARSAAGYTAAGIYAASMAALFGTSAVYHRGRWTEVWRSRMQRLDHAMIFALIAGTFTPLALLAMTMRWGIVVLVVAWTCAAVGIGFSLLRYEIVDRHEGLFYVGFGWLLVLALPAAFHTLTVAELVCLFAGGVLYTVGAVGFVNERPDPRPLTFGYHEVWHVMTVAAAGCHFALVLQLIQA